MADNIFRLLRNFELLERVSSTKGVVVRFVVGLLQSRYFIISASIYLLLAMILAPLVVTQRMAVLSNFAGNQLLVLPEVGPPPPPMREQTVSAKSQSATKNVDVAVKSTMSDQTMKAAKNTAKSRLTVSAPSAYVQASVPVVAPTIGAIDVKIDSAMGAKIADAEIKRLIGVREFQRGWVQGGGSRSAAASASYRHGGGRGVRAKFTVFQAKYQDGDWNCNPSALRNMMLQIRAWSKDRIDAQVVPEVLDIGTDQLFTLKPPFVYLTGHKNFRLLDNEVKNLRDYLTLGGAVWGDSALAGRRSRFDIAFRREMHRVLPDREFEIVPENHEMFDVFFDNIGLPTGMNNYREPIEMINIGGKLAVLYTLNGYGHFWEARLNKDGKIEWGRINVAEKGKPPQWRHVYGPHLYSPRSESSIIYRGINDETERNAYKFGINVVVHLLTRYQRDFMLLPKELPQAPTTRSRITRPTGGDEAGTNAVVKEDAPKGSVKIESDNDDKDKDKNRYKATGSRGKSTKVEKDK